MGNRYNEEALKITSRYTGYDAKNELYNVKAVFYGFLNGYEFVIKLKTNIKTGPCNYSVRLGGLWFGGYHKSYKMCEIEGFLVDGLDRLKHLLKPFQHSCVLVGLSHY